jgi:methylated-DNA-[protein]-cysteine S-methyltransferase
MATAQLPKKQRDLLPCGFSGFSEHALIAEALGEANPELSQQVQSHLADCSSCANLREQYQALQVQLDTLSPSTDELSGLQHARQALDAQLNEQLRPRLRIQTWQSPIGEILVGSTQKGVALVDFGRPDESSSLLERLQQDFTVEQAEPDTAALGQQLDEYFHGTRQTFDWTVDDRLMRSDFQRKVLRATAEIPYGTVITYQGVADIIEQPKAVRAVAQALRHNPVPIHIPCHRVLGSDGRLTGYAGNLVDLKQRILETEGIPIIETSKGLCISKARLYVGWRSQQRLCRPDCRTLKEQTAGERVFMPSQTRAQEIGYALCDVCHPEHYPLEQEKELWPDA